MGARRCPPARQGLLLSRGEVSGGAGVLSGFFSGGWRRWESRRASAGAGGGVSCRFPLSTAAGRGPPRDRCGRGLGGEDRSEGVGEGRRFHAPPPNPPVCVLRPSAPQKSSAVFFQTGFAMLMTGEGFLFFVCVCSSHPTPPAFPCVRHASEGAGK